MSATLQATVLIPTMSGRGPLLPFSVDSVLTQTVADIEVFIMGDGVDESTRRVIQELMRDSRIRFFDHPKHERRGEPYRHAALAQARGRIVCYLADRDLWLPHHIETTLAVLEHADFGHTRAVQALMDDSYGSWNTDLSQPADRERHLAGIDNRIALSCVGHTLAMYRRLPHGWRNTPPDLWTDLYMWQQFMTQPTCKVASSPKPTALVFPSPERKGWTSDQRLVELLRWRKRLAEPGYIDKLLARYATATSPGIVVGGLTMTSSRIKRRPPQ